jgi:hypothetical protein
MAGQSLTDLYFALPQPTFALIASKCLKQYKEMHISLTGANLLSQLDVTLPFNPIEGVFSIIKREFYKHGSIEGWFLQRPFPSNRGS